MDIDPDEINRVPGYESESVAPERRTALPERAAFVHLDATCTPRPRTACRTHVGGILRHGTVVGFDATPSPSSGARYCGATGIPHQATRHRR